MCLYYVREVTKMKIEKENEIFSIGHGGQLKKRNVIPPKNCQIYQWKLQ